MTPAQNAHLREFPFAITDTSKPDFFFDDFSRPDANGATSPTPGKNALHAGVTGQLWTVTGNHWQQVTLSGGWYYDAGADTGSIYAYIPQRHHSAWAAGKFRFHGSGPGSICIAFTPANAPSLQTWDLLHFVVDRTGTWTLSTRQNNGAFTVVSSGFFAGPLETDVEYFMGITVLGTSVKLDLPDGAVQQVQVALAPQLTGGFLYWQSLHTSGGSVPEWSRTVFVPLD